jgi:dTDP-4-dehydrorhamnose reductase
MHILLFGARGQVGLRLLPAHDSAVPWLEHAKPL